MRGLHITFNPVFCRITWLPWGIAPRGVYLTELVEPCGALPRKCLFIYLFFGCPGECPVFVHGRVRARPTLLRKNTGLDRCPAP
jgi:hypothetical protein